MPRIFKNGPPENLGIGAKLGTVGVAPVEKVFRKEIERRKPRDRPPGRNGEGEKSAKKFVFEFSDKLSHNDDVRSLEDLLKEAESLGYVLIFF